MSNVKVRPEQVADAVIKALAEYNEQLTDKLDILTKKAARATKADLKASAPSGGSYARGWSNRAVKGGAYGLAQVVYNRSDYQLIHLLEKPHATRFGYYPKHVDYTGTLARVEEQETQRYYEEVISKL